MRFPALSCIVSVALLLAMAVPLPAQDQPTPPAHVSYVEGDATLFHDGETEPAVLNMPVFQGDRIRTTNGRVEVMFSEGLTLEIDPESDVEFVGGTRVRVLGGTVDYHAAVAATSASSQYLPSDLQPYGSDFDRYGSWQYETGYGSVWYPTVAVDWRPYYYGYWAPVRPYGWSWIGYDRWTWPTHHYGRWGYAHQRWFWIPGRTWAAAWVSWGTAPNYVSWCPLGADGRPVVAFSLGYPSGWNAWTFMPRDRFGVRGYPAHRYAVEPSRIASTTPFLIHRSAPLMNDRRTTAAIAGATTAVPRYDQSPNTIRSTERGTYKVPARQGRVPSPPANAPTPKGGDSSSRASERAAVPSGAPAAVYRTPGGNRAGEYRVPRPGSVAPVTAPGIVQPRLTEPPSQAIPQQPVTGDRRPTTNDHPRYQPRNEARPEPRQTPPARESAPVGRPAPPPARGTAATAPNTRSAAPAARESGRSSQGRSEGTAVRRPR